MPEKQEVPQVANLGDAAAAYTSTNTEVQQLQRQRDTLAQQLATLDAQLNEAKQKLDRARGDVARTVQG